MRNSSRVNSYQSLPCGCADNSFGCLTSFLILVVMLLLTPSEQSFTPESLQQCPIPIEAWLECYQWRDLEDSLLSFILKAFLRNVFSKCPKLKEGRTNQCIWYFKHGMIVVVLKVEHYAWFANIFSVLYVAQRGESKRETKPGDPVTQVGRVWAF